MTKFDEYTAACEVFEKAHAELTRLISKIKSSGQILEHHWFKSTVSEDQISFQVPSSTGHSSLTAETWPSVEDIATAIKAAQQAISKVKELYKSLPDAQRKLVYLPDVISRLYS